MWLRNGRALSSIRTPSEQEISALLGDHEEQHFDCKDKAKKPGGIPKYIAGFANARGGVLVLGLKDQKAAAGRERLAGFSIPEDANAHIATITREIDPPVDGLVFTFLDCGAAPAGFLLHVTVPRSAFLHRVAGTAYRRDGAATNPLDDKRTRAIEREKAVLRWSRRAAWMTGLLLPGLFLLYLSAFLYGHASEPELASNWFAYPTQLGFRSEYELRLEIGEAAGAGIVDLASRMTFPAPVMRASIVDDGGCERLAVVPHVLRAVTPDGADEQPGNGLDLRAARCPPRARPAIRMEVASGNWVHDSPLVSDDGRLEGSYGWLVPVLGFRAPSRRQLDLTLKAPNSQWHGYTIPTRGFPASLSLPPYYDLDTKRGHVVSFITRADYESLPEDSASSLGWIATPSARIRLGYQSGRFKGWIRWLPCEKPVEVEAPRPMNIPGADAAFRAIALRWEGCSASIAFSGAERDHQGNFVTLPPR